MSVCVSCACARACAGRQLLVHHCLDRIMRLHTERGGDTLKAAHVDNSLSQLFSVKEKKKS